MGDHASVTVERLPLCDIHKYGTPSVSVEAMYDGKTREGPWANMCRACFYKHGLGLGLGLGQQLIVREPLKS